MSKRHQTPEEKAQWAAYMREYRSRHKREGDEDDAPLQPTERQLEILKIYADPTRGGSQRAVAEALGISVSAVHNQLQRLMHRLGVREPSQAVMKLWVTSGPSEDLSEPSGQAPSSEGPARARTRRTRDRG